MTDKPIDTHELEPADAPKKGDVTPSIQWLLVESRHSRYAAQLKKSDREAYHDYIVGLVFTLDGQPVRMPHALTKKTVGQIVAAFEERFGEDPARGQEA